MCSVWCLLVCVVCVIEPGPKTKGLGILIVFGGGRYWSKEYQKNTRKFKICIISHMLHWLTATVLEVCVKAEVI